jgi:hypothetical protein
LPALADGVDQQPRGIGRNRRGGVERHRDIPGVDGVLADPDPGHPGGVQVHPEQVQVEPGQLIRVERLQPLERDCVGVQAIGGLNLRAPGVPGVPDGTEHLAAGRILSLQAGVQPQAEDLGLRSEMREHLGDRPLARVGRLLQLLGVEGLDDGQQPVVRVPEGVDPRPRAGFHGFLR